MSDKRGKATLHPALESARMIKGKNQGGALSKPPAFPRRFLNRRSLGAFEEAMR
jgi:hypothetical protein